jgi:hypothetical protein
MFRYTVVLITSFVALTASAQLRQSPDACRKMWGSPSGSRLDDEGTGRLTYESRGTRVTLEFDQLQVYSAHYSRSDFSRTDIEALLKLNCEDQTWIAWTPPGIPASEVKGRIWMRSDDAAMAELRNGRLSILGQPVIIRADTETNQVIKPSRASETVAPVAPAKKPVVVPAKKVSRSTPARPAQLPEVGATMAQAEVILGPPNGIMDTGGKQVMIYAWGNVWIAEGKVESID